jgi:hypothetical protein
MPWTPTPGRGSTAPEFWRWNDDGTVLETVAGRALRGRTTSSRPGSRLACRRSADELPSAALGAAGTRHGIRRLDTPDLVPSGAVPLLFLRRCGSGLGAAAPTFQDRIVRISTLSFPGLVLRDRQKREVRGWRRAEVQRVMGRRRWAFVSTPPRKPRGRTRPRTVRSNARLHARGHQGDGEVAPPRRGEGARSSGHPRKRVPPPLSSR